ncbi:hypothetical protein AVEN_163530-1 [Araneus ventricosus]|uniref:Uncharacterized protein n=1 Tax=Araneus ventricosus TaxID=182803 RepID=A0A4Y2BPQ4_ARAVE|nr:hypothetical protein AVEN_163530-1 [Araneus ventricosus]
MKSFVVVTFGGQRLKKIENHVGLCRTCQQTRPSKLMCLYLSVEVTTAAVKGPLRFQGQLLKNRSTFPTKNVNSDGRSVLPAHRPDEKLKPLQQFSCENSREFTIPVSFNDRTIHQFSEDPPRNRDS